jgi:hypothetical protein
LKLVDRLIPITKYPHDKLQLKLCKIMSQVKMRMYKAASDELDLIGDFEHRDNTYEAYPDLYPKLKGKSTKQISNMMQDPWFHSCYV